MENDKPICGACEHFDFKNKKIVPLFGNHKDGSIVTAICLKSNGYFVRSDRQPYSNNCFKLWEEK